MQETKVKIDLTAASNHIVKWLKDYSNRAGTNGFVIGISGGVDSAVASTLCAMTELPLLCVEMPIHQNASHVSRAVNHIKWLQERFDNVSVVNLNLTTTFDTLSGILFDAHSKLDYQPAAKHDLALANTRSRLRMIGLYHFAALTGRLVCGTGNKVEDFGVGFYTKYGDGGVDISPIADLMKTEVWAMAEVLGVNQEIVEAVPSDGLWDDTRSDEDQIGASYPELEWAMGYVEKNPYYTPEDLDNLSEREQQVLRIYKDFNSRNQHKMNPIPICDVSQFRE